MKTNLRTRLRQRRSDGMRGYDALPPELRLWLQSAALPWSAGSLLRLWRKALHETGGDIKAARAQLDAAEARLIARDAAQVWGPGYPAPVPDQAGSFVLRR